MMFKQSTSYARYLNVLLLCPTTPYLRSYATAVSHSVLLFLRADDSYNTGYHTGCRRYFPVCPFPFCFGEDRFSLSMTSALPNNLLIQSTQIWYSTFRCVQFQQSSKSNEQKPVEEPTPYLTGQRRGRWNNKQTAPTAVVKEIRRLLRAGLRPSSFLPFDKHEVRQCFTRSLGCAYNLQHSSSSAAATSYSHQLILFAAVFETMYFVLKTRREQPSILPPKLTWSDSKPLPASSRWSALGFGPACTARMQNV